MNQRIEEIFVQYTQIWFYKRDINKHQEQISRKDYTYNDLTRKFYYAEDSKKQKLLVVWKLLESQKEPAYLAKASYIYALLYNWEKAIKLIQEVIILEKWDNIDSWEDFWLFIRKIPAYRDLSIDLLFHLEHTIDNYKGEGDIIWFLEKLYG